VTSSSSVFDRSFECLWQAEVPPSADLSGLSGTAPLLKTSVVLAMPNAVGTIFKAFTSLSYAFIVFFFKS